MKTYIQPSPDKWEEICRKRAVDESGLQEKVGSILSLVRNDGDKALLDMAVRFDRVKEGLLQQINPDCPLKVTEEEFAAAQGKVAPEVKAAIAKAKDNIESFHTRQKACDYSVETVPGVVCSYKRVPIRRVGLYIPGGTAPLFSTVLMLAVPAQIAGCPDVILCTPPRADGSVDEHILYTAKLCGITTVYKCGGAGAIAAMAYGTESITKRDKIFGPGNHFVMKAKQMVQGDGVAIDMPAGPSEVMVLADETAVPAFVAADLLSQAEHGVNSQAVLVCTSEGIAKAVQAEIDRQLRVLPRQELLLKSLEGSFMCVLKDRDDMLSFAETYAPEHLILSVDDPSELASRVYRAGSVFLGNYSPESAGDYASGTNHTLPTSSWARSFSGVGVESFCRHISFQGLSPEGLRGLSDTIRTMADAEGLAAHSAAVTVRLSSLEEACPE